MAERYMSIVTDAGEAELAAAWLTGNQKVFKYIAVGDSGGSYYEPSSVQTSLRGEKWRGDAMVSQHPSDPKKIIISGYIPIHIGGFQIREAGVFDENGKLMIVSKQPLSDKVSPDSGAGVDTFIKISVEIKQPGSVMITVDPSAQMVSYMDLWEHTQNQDIHITAGFRDEMKALIATHNFSGNAHGDIRAEIAGLDSRLKNVETIVGGGIAKNPFSVTFVSLAGVNVSGVWNQAQGRIDF